MTTPEPAGAGAPRANRWLLAAGGVLLLAIGVTLVTLFLPGVLNTTDAPPPDAAATPATAPATSAQRTIRATLYFVAPTRTELVPVVIEVPYAPTATEQARRILEAQVGTPPEGQVTTIPTGTIVRTVFLTKDGRAYVDLGGPIISGHAGGSLNESLTVYAIVNALTVNLPDISAVQILVEGREVESLTGHLDLRSPLGRSMRWVQQPRGQ
ncbi:MAG: GerMN domain-containing protein [Vicinamibacterales bacterium]